MCVCVCLTYIHIENVDVFVICILYKYVAQSPDNTKCDHPNRTYLPGSKNWPLKLQGGALIKDLHKKHSTFKANVTARA